MADDRRKQTLAAFLSIPGWLDWLGKAWPLLGALFGASALSWLAGITEWVSGYGPFAWGVVFLATFLLLYGAFLLGVAVRSRARERNAQAAYAEGVASSATINPLDRIFDGKRIDMRDFYHQFFRWHHRPVFTNCEIFGPANLAFRGTPAFSHCSFNDCEIVIVQPNVGLTGVIGLDSPTFERSALYRMTFFMHPIDAGRFVAASHGELRVVSMGDPILPQQDQPEEA